MEIREEEGRKELGEGLVKDTYTWHSSARQPYFRAVCRLPIEAI